MFDFIKSHIDPYRGPAQGVGTEHGDTWPEAVAKINAAFKKIAEAFETGMAPQPNPDAPKPVAIEDIASLISQAVTPLNEEIASLKNQLESASARMAAMEGFFTAQSDPNLPADDTAKMPPVDVDAATLAAPQS